MMANPYESPKESVVLNEPGIRGQLSRRVKGAFCRIIDGCLAWSWKQLAMGCFVLGLVLAFVGGTSVFCHLYDPSSSIDQVNDVIFNDAMFAAMGIAAVIGLPFIQCGVFFLLTHLFAKSRIGKWCAARRRRGKSAEIVANLTDSERRSLGLHGALAGLLFAACFVICMIPIVIYPSWISGVVAMLLGVGAYSAAIEWVGRRQKRLLCTTGYAVRTGIKPEEL
jgi:hypothetical protein